MSAFHVTESGDMPASLMFFKMSSAPAAFAVIPKALIFVLIVDITICLDTLCHHLPDKSNFILGITMLSMSMDDTVKGCGVWL